MSQSRPDAVQTLLAPLLKGKAVCLRVDDPRLPKKTRKYRTVIVLSPVTLLGLPGFRLLAAMPPYGSEFLDPAVDLKATTFARLGLSFTLADALSKALRKLYGV